MSTTTVRPTVRIDVTDKTPLAYDLLSVAEVQPSSRHMAFEYETVCGQGTAVAPDLCRDGSNPDFDPTKDDTYELTDATSDTVVLYARTTCNLVGRDKARLDTLATQVLNLGEGRGLTTKVIEMALEDANAVTVPGPIGELTKDTSKMVLALAENTARSYPGGGVILMPTMMALLAGVTAVGNHLETPFGTKVAIYETDPEDTSWDTFVFSRIVVTRGVAELGSGMQVIARHNQYVVMAERPYSVGYDCTPTRITATAA